MSKHSANVAAAAAAAGHTHVRSSHVANSAGFGNHVSGGDTSPGPGPGAPLKQAKVTDDRVVSSGHDTQNPYNPHDQNEAGVLAPSLSRRAPAMDSPVPAGHQTAHGGDTAKASAVAREIESIGSTFPNEGVLGRG